MSKFTCSTCDISENTVEDASATEAEKSKLIHCDSCTSTICRMCDKGKQIYKCEEYNYGDTSKNKLGSRFHCGHVRCSICQKKEGEKEWLTCSGCQKLCCTSCTTEGAKIRLKMEERTGFEGLGVFEGDVACVECCEMTWRGLAEEGCFDVDGELQW